MVNDEVKIAIPSPETVFAHRLLDGLADDPNAILEFEKIAPTLSDDAYWGFLGALCAGNRDLADVDLWRRLLSSGRPHRNQNLMKPAEYAMWRKVPARITAYRLHMAGEKQWLTMPINLQETMARHMAAPVPGSERIGEYIVRRGEIHAVFLRGGPLRVLVLDSSKLQHVGDIPIIANDERPPAT